MVKLLVADNDTQAGALLATLHNTRTLHSVEAVCAENLRKVLANILNAGVRVVVPADHYRWNDEVLLLAGILEQLGMKPISVDAYLHEMNAPPAALAGQPRLPVAQGELTHR